MRALGLELALLMTLGAVRAEVLTGHVVGVADGDTITVLDADKVQHKVRLSGIDALEKNQPFGQFDFQFHCTFRQCLRTEPQKEDSDQYSKVLMSLEI